MWFTVAVTKSFSGRGNGCRHCITDTQTWTGVWVNVFQEWSACVMCVCVCSYNSIDY